jgi:hypothetical protein
MRTFDTTLRSHSFWLAVILPPFAYWIIVQIVAVNAGDGPMSLTGLMLLVGLANVLPFGALAWTVCSVAAYSVAPGRIIEHRVVRDRQFNLAALVERPRVSKGVVVLRAHEWTLRLRVTHPEVCLALVDQCRSRFDEMSPFNSESATSAT